jgi:DNA repair photolyase
MELIESTVHYKEVECKSFLHNFDKKYLPFRWGANPYRGCEHSCPYCFARYTHEYLGYNTESDFENIIHIKMNAPKILEKELSSLGWRKASVNLGSVCDPYQPAERKYEISRQLLNVFLKHENPVFIGTKSNLVTRDIDVLSEMAKRNLVRVNFTITTLNEGIRSKIEPRAPSTTKRIDSIKQLADNGVIVDILLMPIFPYLTDNIENLNGIVKEVKEAGARCIIPGVLNLRSSCKRRVFTLMKNEYPELYQKYLNLYKRAYAPRNFTSRIYKAVKAANAKYGVKKLEIDMLTRKQTILETWIVKQIVPASN